MTRTPTSIRAKLILGVLVFLAMSILSLNAHAQQIANISPTIGVAGTQVTISGSGFGDSQGSGNVWLGSTYGVVLGWSDTQVVVAVALGAKSGSAQVLQGGVWSNAVDFTVVTPNITGVSPATGVAGTQVTVTGTGFGAAQGNGNLWLGSTYGVVTSWNDTQVVATVASGAKSGSAQVLQGGVWSNAVTFSVVTPSITGVSPATGVAGTQVTVTGTGFGSTQGSGNLWLGSTYGVVTIWSDTQIVATVASGAKSGSVQVLQGGVWSNSVTFSVVTPNITGVSPVTGVAGTQVTITGTGFGATQGSGNLWLGSTYGVVTSWSDMQIVATVASGAKSGSAQVLQGGVWSNSVTFSIVTPNITGVSPATGVAGTQVTITGTGFGATQGSGNLWLGSTYGVVSSWSDTQIVATVASGSKTGSAQVLQGGVWSNSVTFSVATPNIIGVSPATGIAGTQVTITGTGFGAAQGAGNIWLGSTYGVVTSWSDTQIVATVASGSKTGSAQVLQGGVWSNSVDFTVVTPNITGVSPAAGAVGTQVTITGTGFGAAQGSGNLWLGSTYGVVSSWSDTQIVATVAMGSASGSAQVLQGGVWSNAVNFSVGSGPSISSLSPTSGPVGSPVTIIGTGFGATQGSSTVTFNSIPGAATSWSDTSIVVSVPNGATSGNVQVIVSGLVSNGSNFTVTNPGPTILSLSPQSGPIGTLVTITGTSFGAAQGTGSVMLGTQPGTVLSWSDTQVAAFVAPNSTSGVAQVTQNGIASNSLNFTVATPVITGVSPASASVASQVTITGSGFGAAQGNGQAYLGTKYGVVLSWNDTEVIATVAPGSMSRSAQILVSGLASNSLNFTVLAPAITSVAPTSGNAGTQVTIAGTGFGATQGSGRVLLGTGYGAVISWSDTLVVAAVPLGSSSGAAQVWQGGVGSNTETFTVTTPIVSGVSPSIGGAGTQVTIAGSGFGAAQGSGSAWLGTAYATVVSWNDSEIVATVAPGSASGIAQVLQNGVWSNSVPFSTLTPQIVSVTPNSGVAGTQVAIIGSGFGASQGSGILWLGSTNGDIVSWSDAQVVATVDSSAKSGKVRIQQNGIWSNALQFIVPTVGSGNDVTMVPNAASMLVGETRTIQALNASGAPALGLAWTSSDVTVASLSTDDPPILTALAPGHISITAGDASAEVTVFAGSSLPIGTVIWSAPGDGSGVQKILPAVPSPSGVADVFAVMSSGNVQAITADGSVAWTANVGSVYPTILPDFQGGLVADNGSAILKVDGMTGQTTSQYPYSSDDYVGGLAIHPSGIIFSYFGQSGSLVGIDPATGAAKFTIPLEHWTDSWSAGCGGTGGQLDYPPNASPLIIAGDGLAYLLYQYSEYSSTCEREGDFSNETDLFKDHVRLLRVATDGNFQKIDIGDWTQATSSSDHIVCENGSCGSDSGSNTVSGTVLAWGDFTKLVTNADQGVALALNYELLPYCSSVTYDNWYNVVRSGCVAQQDFNRMVLVSGGAVASDSNVNLTSLEGDFTPILQAEDGTYFGTGVTADNSMDAFDLSGNVKWSVPGFTPVMATADGGLIAQSSTGQYVTFDQNGVANGMLAQLPTQSWIQNTYEVGSIDLAAFLPISYASSFLAMLGGNNSQNGTSVHQTWFPPLASCYGPNPYPTCPGPAEVAYSAFGALESLLSAPCPLCQQWVFAKLPGGNTDNNSIQSNLSVWLKKSPQLYDGTKSNAPQWFLCFEGSWLGIQCDLHNPFKPTPTVADYFAEPLHIHSTTNLTKSPSKFGFVTYFNPFFLTGSCHAQHSTGTRQKSILFHEALHGFPGLSDPDLQNAFSIDVDQSNTGNISDYIAQKVFGWVGPNGQILSGITDACDF